MAWKNTSLHFGRVSRALHWGMAVLVLGMLILGTELSRMQPGLANLWLYGLHKSGGMLVLGLALARLAWHRVSPPPPSLGEAGAWVNRLARGVHGAIYLLLLAIPLAGWVGSSATGIDIVILDRWILPPIAPVSERWEAWGFALHGVLTKALMALLALHVAGALKRAWEGDGTLRRMIKG